MSKTVTVRVLGYNDMFSVGCGLENLTVLEIGGNNLLIEAPCHAFWSMSEVGDRIITPKIDGVMITHGDADHKAGLEKIIWNTYFKYLADGDEKLILATHPQIAEKQIWAGMKPMFGIDRIDSKTEMRLTDYVNFVKLELGRKVKVSGFGIEVKTFKTQHAHFLTIAFQIWKDGKPILAYSGDTRYDRELIALLAKDGNHPIIHEAGAYTPKSAAHTHIKELLRLPKKLQKRIYINHVPRKLEIDIHRTIRDSGSPIRFACDLNGKKLI